MSYVITSNQFNPNAISTSERESAYSYHNTTSDTFTIEPNSEIAVASVKVNKSNRITINKGMKFYSYLGKYINQANGNAGKTTTIPHIAEITNSVTGSSEYEEVNPEILADRLTTALNNSIFNIEQFGLCEAGVKYDAATHEFKGMNYATAWRPSGESGITPRETIDVNTAWTNLYQPLIDDPDNEVPSVAGLTWAYADKSLISVAHPDTDTLWANVADCRDWPIGTNYTGFEADCLVLTGTNWAIGLARSDEGTKYMPPHFSIADSEIPMYHMQFYDYVIMGTQNAPAGDRYIRIYCAMKTRGSDDITMREIKYYDNTSSFLKNPSTPYNWSTNNANKKLQKFIFTIKNEQVIIEAVDQAGATHHITGSNDAGATSKMDYPKPICNTCNVLYPRCFIQASGKKMIITSIGGSSDNDEFNIYNNVKYDWNAWLENNGTYHSNGGVDVDTRFYNDSEDATQYTALGLNAFGAGACMYPDYENVFVVAPDDTYYYPSNLANMSRVMGFQDLIRVDWAGAKSGACTEEIRTWVSISPDSMLESLSSLFIRLNQLNIRTLNAGKGLRSMILYHLPRFDAGGNATGSGLYYEPNERIYIKLNNTEKLTLNDWWVDIVNEDESLSRSLTGKTIVTFHIRDSVPSKREGAR